MGNFLKSFLTFGNEVKECARNEAYLKREENNFPVKLIEPSTGRIVQLEVTEQKENIAKIYMNLLIKYAQTLEQDGAQWKVINGGKTIEIIFINDNMAENTRKFWRK